MSVLRNDEPCIADTSDGKSGTTMKSRGGSVVSTRWNEGGSGQRNERLANGESDMWEAVGRKDWKNEIFRSLIKCEWIDAFSRACSPVETTRSSKWWTEPKEEFKVTFVARRRRSRPNLFCRVSIICFEKWQTVYEPNRLVNISLLYPCSIRALYFYVVTAQNSRPHCVTHRYRGIPDTYLPPDCTLLLYLRRMGIWWSRRVVSDVTCAVNVVIVP